MCCWLNIFLIDMNMNKYLLKPHHKKTCQVSANIEFYCLVTCVKKLICILADGFHVQTRVLPYKNQIVVKVGEKYNQLWC